MTEPPETLPSSAVPGLHALLNPDAIALIGVSDDPLKMSGNPLRALRNGNYTGEVYPVNPARETVGGLKSYRTVLDIPGPVDVAVITLPAERVISALTECGEKGVKAALVISAGFAEGGGAGVQLQDELAAVARRYGIRVVGPNCTGYYSGERDLPCGTSASFVTGRFYRGSTTVVTQSGALGTSLLAQGKERHIGMRLWASTGNEMDLTVADFMLAGALDDKTTAICVYLESLRDVATATLAATAALNANKPIVALKVGSSPIGAERAMAHTGAMIGSDKAYTGFFEKFGILRVDSIDNLLPVASVFASRRRWNGGRVGVFSISGAFAAHIADRLEEAHLELSSFEAHTLETLKRTSRNESAGNPYDPTGLGIGEPHLVAEAMEAIVNDATVDVVVIAFTFSIHMLPIAARIAARVAQHTDKLVCVIRWLPDDHLPELFEPFEALQVPVFRSLEECAVALSCRNRYERRRPTLLKALVDRNSERGTRLTGKLNGSSGILLEIEGRELLRHYGIEGPAESTAITPDEAVAAARKLGYPIVMKILSREVTHKTEAGGVLVGVRDDEEVRVGFSKLLDNFSANCPGAQLEGVLVQRVAPDGLEIIVGSKHEFPFGPVVMVGVGGVLAEAIGKVAVRPVPISRSDAEAMITEAGLGPLLASARRGRRSDRAALVTALVGMSELMQDHSDRISEAEVNPLRVLLEGDGALALDALITLK